MGWQREAQRLGAVGTAWPPLVRWPWGRSRRAVECGPRQGPAMTSLVLWLSAAGAAAAVELGPPIPGKKESNTTTREDAGRSRTKSRVDRPFYFEKLEQII